MNVRKIYPRIVATLLCLTALAGLGLSIAGIVLVQKARPVVLDWSTQQIALLRDTLATLDDTLSAAEQTLGSASNSLTEVQRALSTSANALGDSQPMLDEFQTLLDDSVPKTVEDTQQALYAAQKDAATIEATIAALSAIPFMPGDPYQPEQSLSESLGKVAYTLGNIPDSTAKISDDLDIAKSNLALMQVDLMSTSLQLDDIEQSLAEARNIIPQYRDLLTRTRRRIETLEMRLPATLKAAATALTVFFVWLALTQIGLLLQGLDWWQRGAASAAPPPPAA